MNKLQAMKLSTALVVMALLSTHFTAKAENFENVQIKATVHFGTSASSLRPLDQEHLLDEVGQMKDVTWNRVTATGFTDSRGAQRLNEKLSMSRAASVTLYLIDKGIKPSMIQTRAGGSTSPVASNRTAAGRAKNRRTEVEFTGVRPVR